jgi:hypothetical protein
MKNKLIVDTFAGGSDVCLTIMIRRPDRGFPRARWQFLARVDFVMFVGHACFGGFHCLVVSSSASLVAESRRDPWTGTSRGALSLDRPASHLDPVFYHTCSIKAS